MTKRWRKRGVLGIAIMAGLVAMPGARGSESAARTILGRQDRVLLVTTNLVTQGDPKYKWLYRFLEGSSVVLAKQMLGRAYHKMYLLGGKHATGKAFAESIPYLASDPKTSAIDVMVHLHGSPGMLWFDDDGYFTASLAQKLKDGHLGGKARLFYSTACYGATHAQDFVDAGFEVASGSIGVNADSAYSYPVTMLKWRLGSPYANVVYAANSRISIWVSDHIARLMGFGDVNSFKVIKGDLSASIGLGSPALETAEQGDGGEVP
jgi:hypothetical protein